MEKITIATMIQLVTDIPSDFSARLLPKGTMGTVVECYQQPECYAVDLAIPAPNMVGEFGYENVLLNLHQFVVVGEAQWQEYLQAAQARPLINKIVADLVQTDQLLRQFEQRYWLSSEVFYEFYHQGQLSQRDKTDFQQWADYYQRKQRWENLLNQFSRQRFGQLPQKMIDLVPIV